jgi:hypothetical protein
MDYLVATQAKLHALGRACFSSATSAAKTPDHYDNTCTAHHETPVLRGYSLPSRLRDTTFAQQFAREIQATGE